MKALKERGKKKYDNANEYFLLVFQSKKKETKVLPDNFAFTGSRNIIPVEILA